MSIADLAAAIRSRFLDQPFGIVRLWGFAAVRPNDQAWRLVSTQVEGDRLDLFYVHDSRTGPAGVLSLWSPAQLAEAPAHEGRGIVIVEASRVCFEGVEARLEGGILHLHTPRGDGALPHEGAPALLLAT